MHPALFFEPGPFPGFPGPVVGPKGPTIGQKPRAGFIMFILPEVCPARCSKVLIQRSSAGAGPGPIPGMARVADARNQGITAMSHL